MKPRNLGLKSIGIVILLVLITHAAIGPVQAATRTGKKAPPDRYVTIDFNNVDINVFIKFISELTGKNFIVDQRVKGNVTIISPTKISISEAYRVFESVLEVHGYTTVKAGTVVKILPSPDARTKNIETRFNKLGSPEDRLVTQLIPLTYADPNDIKRLFTPLVSRNSVIAAYPPTNMLIITDIYSNIKRLMRIVKEIDVAGVGQEISVIPLENADSTKLVSTLSTVFQATPAGKKGQVKKTIKFVADERTNTIIVLASEVDTFRIKELIRLLDRQTPQGKEKIRVYYLEYANSEDMAKVLQEVPSKTTTAQKGKATAPIVSQNVRIVADKATNSLVITADPDDYAVLEEIINKLDIPRPMVYIEALFMEVDVRKDMRLGTEWSVAGKTSVSGKNAAVGGSFNRGVPNSNLPGLVTGTLPSGFSMGVFTEAITIGGVSFNNLAAMINAFQEDSNVNILQTPQILTTENEEAKINVGKNVPYQTSVSTSNNDTFNQFEYRDVGTILTITPNISLERLVRLTISLEISVLEDPDATTLQPTTLKRTVDTTVIVQDKSTVVIGGLIDSTRTDVEEKVPLLGDIPLLGWLFKYRSERNEKQNLFVFLTPHVIKNPEEAEKVYGRKKIQMDSLKEGKVKLFKKKQSDADIESESKPPM
jgi:general secretion pathway protein D